MSFLDHRALNILAYFALYLLALACVRAFFGEDAGRWIYGGGLVALGSALVGYWMVRR